MTLAAALIYWIVVAIWAAVLAGVVFSYARNPRLFGTIRLLLIIVGIDTFRNIFENVYFGLYFGSQYGVFPESIANILGQPSLLLVPKVLNLFAGCVVLGLLFFHWVPRAAHEWGQSEKRASDLGALAATDPLTDLNNRRQFEFLAHAEFVRCQRYLRPLSILVIDIDHFKHVNDRFGHAIGDIVLKAVAETIVAAKRGSDVAARIGGEEFALLLPETTAEIAQMIAQRIRHMIRDRSLPVSIPNVTVSIGVASAPAGGSGVEDLMVEADEALYEAKGSGRDCVVVSRVLAQRILASAG
jgi:diguanylate cyclase (GGDEF)-like protein